MIQVRHVPDQLHRTLKARAAMKGMTLSDYLLREMNEIAARPTIDEMLERLAQRSRVELAEPAAESIRLGREERS
jgi:plasmid stability protein